MKKLIVGAISGIIVMSASTNMSLNSVQAASEEYVEEGYYVEVAASDGGVNMRQGPGVEYEIVREMIPNGEILYIEYEGIATNGNSWGYTEYEGIEGWVSLNMVQEIEYEYEEEESVPEEEEPASEGYLFEKYMSLFLDAIEQCEVDKEYREYEDLKNINKLENVEEKQMYGIKTIDPLVGAPYVEITSDKFTTEKYIGDLKNNKPDGNGIICTIYGEVLYVGEFKEGQFHGQGLTMSGFDGGEIAIYLGKFKEGKHDGKGIMFYWDLMSYSNIGYKLYAGKFKDGVCEGKGKLYDSGILIYEGEFKEGMYDGSGIQYSILGNKIYEGEFKDDYRDGQGTEYDEDGNVIYSGKWKDGDYSAE